MNARLYRVQLSPSKVDFPAINGPAMQSTLTHTDVPKIVKNRLLLTITKTFILTETFSGKEHEILKVKSEYSIPTKELSRIEDLYEFYMDALPGLSEVYQFAQTQIPVPPVKFPFEPIENCKQVSESLLQFISSLN